MAKNGFTLLEVMVAVALLTTAVAGLGLALQTGWDSSRRAMLKSKGDALLTLALSEVENPLLNQEGELAAYQASWQYEVEPYLDELYLAKLTVFWQERGTRQSETFAYLTKGEGVYPP